MMQGKGAKLLNRKKYESKRSNVKKKQKFIFSKKL